MLPAVPVAQRRRIVIGMRWAVWLSAVSLPFSYGTTILLARTSPEALGTYGLLNIYIGVVLGLFFLGGDPVVIKFFPELRSERLSFLASYFLVTCVALVPWLLAATIWRGSIHYLLGRGASPQFQLVIMCLAPIVVFTSLVSATLKASLEFAWAHITLRMVTIGSFLIFAVLFAAAPDVLKRSYSPIIWCSYFGLCAIAAVIGLHMLLHAKHWRSRLGTLHFYLPPGFWRYTLSLQQLSALGFLTQRMDAVLVLNFGGLAMLGKYVAVVTLAEAIRLVSRFFTDTLLPSLTNMLAAGDMKAAADVFHTHMRILFLVNTMSTCGLILIARPVTALLGGNYLSLERMVMVLALCVGLSTPGGAGATLLSSIGKQQKAVWVAIGQLVVYLSLFLFLWPRLQLLGAILAYGIGWVIGNSILIIVARANSPFRMTIGRDYGMFVVAALGAAVVAHFLALNLVEGLGIWCVFCLLFLFLAKFTIEECKNLVQWFTPF